jgi:alpha-D-ribose 1-methylphosphonate 5-triphosphate diphosphatase PhnM
MTIHVLRVGDKTLLPQSEFEELVALARQREGIAVESHDDDTPTLAMMRLADQSGAFDFWLEDGEDIYSIDDGEPV